jgi:hypothetical protein
VCAQIAVEALSADQLDDLADRAFDHQIEVDRARSDKHVPNHAADDRDRRRAGEAVDHRRRSRHAADAL